MIGIVLNVTCNVECPQVTEYLLSKETVKMLAQILVDPRHDWPTNGAALALLQYCHTSLSDSDLFLKIEEASVHSVMSKFLDECRNKETKRHLYEAISFIEMARQKMHGIAEIYT